MCCVGEADKRFDEDALRILRALRFSSDLKFKVEINTKNSLIKYKSNLRFIAKERIILEFQKVKNYLKFIEYICLYLGLDFLFKNIDLSSTFIRRERVKINKIYFNKDRLIHFQYPFLYLIVNLNFLYDIKFQKNLLEEFKLWPLNKNDYFLCYNYIKILVLEVFFQEYSMDIEEKYFFIFLHLLIINRASSEALEFILKNIIILFGKEEFTYFLKKIIKNGLDFSCYKISDKIIPVIGKYEIPYNYIQRYIDFYHYHILMGYNNKIESIEDFVKNNKEFIFKIDYLALIWKNLIYKLRGLEII